MWGLCWCPLVIEFWIFGLRPSSLGLGLGLRLGFGAGSCWVRALLDVLCCFRPAVIRGVFGKCSAFRVGWTNAVGGGGALISVFQGFFAGVGGVVTLVVGWVLGCCCVGLCGLETFLIFPNFLRS